MARPEVLARRAHSIAGACILCLLAFGILGCSPPSTVRYAGSVTDNEVIYLIAGGWHTELAIGSQAIRGPLATLKSGFPNAKYLVFGWGAHDYYMAKDPGIEELLRAIVSGPAVMLVVPLEVSPEIFAGVGNAFALPISRDGAERLSEFLWNDLAKDDEGMPRQIGAGPFPQSLFYASTTTYDLAHTCNTWTAAALRVAGLPVSEAGVVFAGQLLDHVRPLAVATPQHVQGGR
jgi:uncharacterized protein (TIGR02117 family)